MELRIITDNCISYFEREAKKITETMKDNKKEGKENNKIVLLHIFLTRIHSMQG